MPRNVPLVVDSARLVAWPIPGFAWELTIPFKY